MIDKANIVYYLPRHLYYYRQRSGSISKNGKSVNTHPLIASSWQRDFIISHYPALKKQADTACFFDAVGVYNDHVFFNITPISENLLKLINEETTRDLKSVLSAICTLRRYYRYISKQATVITATTRLEQSQFCNISLI